MKDFFIKMLSANSGVSSKRFSSFFTLVNIIILTYIATFLSENNQTPEYMFDALALIAGGGLGLTVIEKIFVKREESKKVTKSGEDEEIQ
jgi:lipoprotein signal peptidase